MTDYEKEVKTTERLLRIISSDHNPYPKTPILQRTFNRYCKLTGKGNVNDNPARFQEIKEKMERIMDALGFEVSLETGSRYAYIDRYGGEMISVSYLSNWGGPDITYYCYYQVEKEEDHFIELMISDSYGKSIYRYLWHCGEETMFVRKGDAIQDLPPAFPKP